MTKIIFPYLNEETIKFKWNVRKNDKTIIKAIFKILYVQIYIHEITVCINKVIVLGIVCCFFMW